MERNSKGDFRWSMTACAEKLCYCLASHLFPGFLHFSPRAVLLEPSSSAVTSAPASLGTTGKPHLAPAGWGLKLFLMWYQGCTPQSIMVRDPPRFFYSLLPLLFWKATREPLKADGSVVSGNTNKKHQQC